MQIISWNVASVRARLPLLQKLLTEKNPDIVFLQEIKTLPDTFPYADVEKLGYHAYINGQKGLNGVAVLSKKPLQNITHHLPTFSDTSQARVITAQENQTVYICVYAPNGSAPVSDPADTSRLTYKLAWYQAFHEYLKGLLQQNKNIILGGDFNVIETDDDVYDPSVFQESALMVPAVRHAFKTITDLPLFNTTKACRKADTKYSFWDFQGGAFRRNQGILLDYIFVSDTIKDLVQNAGIDPTYRAMEKPSDHTPVFCVLKEI